MNDCNTEKTNNLTEESFWEAFWGGTKLPCFPDMNFSFDRCLAGQLTQCLSGTRGQALEIGCAPGKWMVFLNRKLGLEVSGIEYSPYGIKITNENLAMLRIKPASLIEGDFFKIEPSQKYDVVISLGFIEHFQNVESVIARHLLWLKPGGKLVLGIPNFRGIYFLLQNVLDEEILKKHNTSIMNLDFFRGVGKKLDLQIADLNYLGSFEPSLPVAQKGFGSLSQATIKCFLKLFLQVRKFVFFDRINHPFFSSYILAVYSKRNKI